MKTALKLFAVALVSALPLAAQTVYPNVQRSTLLVSTRVPFSDANGRLTDASTFTFASGVLTLGTGYVAGVGSAAAPSYTFAGRTTDGYYSYAASQLAWAVGGVVGMRFSRDGNGAYIDNPTGGALLNFTDVGAINLTAGTGNRSITLTSSGTGGTIITGHNTNGGVDLTFTDGASYQATIGKAAGGGANLSIKGSVGTALQLGANGSDYLTIATSGNSLFGTTTDSSNGRIQLKVGTTTADGIGFGTGATIYTQVSNGRGINVSATATNDNAPAGYYGEYVSSLVAIGAPVSLTTNTAANVASISLAAGDWDVEFLASVTETTSTVTARTAGISATSATLPTDGSEGYNGVQSVVTSETNSIPLCRTRMSLTTTTTIYGVEKVVFSAGTAGGFGFLNARRPR